MKTTKITKILSLAGFFLLAGFLFNTNVTNATSYTVSINDTIPSADADCTLREAIENINNQPVQTNSDCAVADGVNDTINLPVGSVILNDNLPPITESVSIIGAGIHKTTINGASQWSVFNAVSNSSQTLNVTDLAVKAWSVYPINARDINLTVERVELDGTDALDTGFGLTGMTIQNYTPDTVNVTIHDVYIHDITNDGDMSGIFISGSSGGTQNINIKRATVANLNAGTGNVQGIMLLGGFGDNLSSANFTGSMQNVTVENITSTGQPSFGVGANIGVSGGTSELNVDFSNMTVRNIRGEGNVFVGNADSIGFGLAGAGLGPTDVVNMSSTVSNLVLSGASGFNQDCLIGDLGGNLGGTGVVNISVTSGGNFSDDGTCATYFNSATDRNNITSLGSTLGPLSNNGGYLPTIPLLAGSPAIDAGVVVSGMTTDARLTARPQGSAFDSGAYEFVAPATAGTLASTGQDMTLLVILAAVVSTISIVILQRLLITKKAVFYA